MIQLNLRKKTIFWIVLFIVALSLNAIIIKTFSNNELVYPPDLIDLGIHLPIQINTTTIYAIYLGYILLISLHIFNNKNITTLKNFSLAFWFQLLFFIVTPINYFDKNTLNIINLTNLGFASAFFTHLFLIVLSKSANQQLKKFVIFFIIISSILMIDFGVIYSSGIVTSFFVAYFITNFKPKENIKNNKILKKPDIYQNLSILKELIKEKLDSLIISTLVFFIGAISTPIAGLFIKKSFGYLPQPEDLIIDQIRPMFLAGKFSEWVMQLMIILFVYTIISHDIKNLPSYMSKIGMIYIIRSFIIILNPLPQLYDPTYKGLLISEFTLYFYQGMYFSGHTAFAFFVYFSDSYSSTTIKYTKLLLAAIVGIFLIISHSHYTVDILMGILVAFFLSKIDIKKYLELRNFKYLGKIHWDSL
jgi:hypothetical protein